MATRGCRQQPFVSTSVWNTPIASTGVTYATAGMTPAAGFAIRGSPIALFMDPNAPATDIHNNGINKSGGGGSTSCTDNATPPGSGPIFVTVPLPAQTNAAAPAINGVYPAASSDNCGWSAVHADGHIYAQGASFAYCKGSAYATAGKVLNGQDLLGDGLGGDTGGAHTEINAGVIRIGELVPGGVIPHALQIIAQERDMYSNAVQSKCFRFPAQTCDGYYFTPKNGHVYSGTDPKLTPGALVALKPSFNMALITSGPGRILATCFMNYGAYICNTVASGNVVAVEVSGGIGTYSSVAGLGDVRQEFATVWASVLPGVPFDNSHSASNAWTRDCITIWANLFIVDSQDNGTPSGTPGAAYRRVLANYTGTPVGAGWDGATGSGAPLVPFPPDVSLNSSGGGGGGIARVGATLQASNPVTAASATQTVVPTLTAGHAAILLIACHDTVSGTSVLSVSDTGGNTWVPISAVAANTNKLTTEVWVCKNVTTGGAQTVTVTMTTATGATTITCLEVSGQNTSSFWDRVSVATGSSTAPDSGPSLATTQAGEFVVGFIAYRGGTIAPTGPTWGSAITSSTTETLNVVTLATQQLASYVVDGTQTAAAIQEFSGTIVTNAWTATVLTFLSAGSATAPGAPGLIAVATGTAGQVKCTITAPSSNGGAAITDYVLQWRTTAGPGAWTTFSHSADPTGTPITVTGLAAASMDFQVAATNGTQGPYSSIATATPTAAPAAPSPPIAPVIDSVGPTDILGDWGPTPPNPGTQPITSYTLRATIVGGGSTTMLINDTNGPGGGPSLTGDFIGLATGVPYTLAALATNIVGSSAYSPESAIATPTLPPGPPTVLTTNYPPAAHPAISPRYAALLKGTGN